jgi:hypothetical protein
MSGNGNEDGKSEDGESCDEHDNGNNLNILQEMAL